jgi:hypothetical protein
MKKMSAYSSISMLVILLFTGIMFAVVMAPVFYGNRSAENTYNSYDRENINERINNQVSEIENVRENTEREMIRYNQEY